MVAEAERGGLSRNDVMRLAADIVAAYVGHNAVGPTGVQDLIAQVFDALSHLGRSQLQGQAHARPRPAVPISRSIQHDFIVCLEDGKKLKMLKRYLRSRYDMSPEDYRRKWNLPPDYPMVAPAYAERRSAFAKQIGLGRGVRRRRVG
jgi:predicted transcriptional regulator